MTLELLLSRRSVRQYTDQSVSDAQIKEVLQAAMNAPSAGNQQPWHFVVIKDKKILQEIAEIHPYAQMAPDAAAAVLVCGDESLEKHQGYWVQDCSAAVQNILLGLHALSLGGVWVGVYPREERVKSFRTLLHIPDSITPFALVPLGYPAEKHGKEDRYSPKRVHMNTW